MLLWNVFILVIFCTRVQKHMLLAQNTPDRGNSSANTTSDNDSNKGKPGIVILYSKHSTKDDVKMKESTFVTRDRTIHESVTGMFNNKNNEPPLLPRIVPGMPTEPNCARGGNFCLHHIDYPLEIVESILSRDEAEFSSLYKQIHPYPANDYMPHDNYTFSYRRKGHFVCESEVQYIQPGWAKNWKNQWMLVVNTEKYTQHVKLEICKFQGKKCEYLPPCYKSICIQRFTPVKLLSIDPVNLNAKPIIDVFDIPSVCSCFVENFIYY